MIAPVQRTLQSPLLHAQAISLGHLATQLGRDLGIAETLGAKVQVTKVQGHNAHQGRAPDGNSTCSALQIW